MPVPVRPMTQCPEQGHSQATARPPDGPGARRWLAWAEWNVGRSLVLSEIDLCRSQVQQPLELYFTCATAPLVKPCLTLHGDRGGGGAEKIARVGRSPC